MKYIVNQYKITRTHTHTYIELKRETERGIVKMKKKKRSTPSYTNQNEITILSATKLKATEETEKKIVFKNK